MAVLSYVSCLKVGLSYGESLPSKSMLVTCYFSINGHTRQGSAHFELKWSFNIQDSASGNQLRIATRVIFLFSASVVVGVDVSDALPHLVAG